jgi:hypothetical protein
MLLGAELHIHTYHKNTLNIGDSSQCRLQWISYVNKYGPKLHYVDGSANVIAVTFSWLLWKDTPASPAVGKKRPAEYIIDKDDVDETPLDKNCHRYGYASLGLIILLGSSRKLELLLLHVHLELLRCLCDQYLVDSLEPYKFNILT